MSGATAPDLWVVAGISVEGVWRDAFALAWESWVAGSLAIGAVLVDGTGIVARGRNRVLEERHSGPVAGTFLAHAEMDAFADLGIRTAEGLTLYTTVEPCLMCSATAIAMRLSRVVYAAPDPVFEGLSDVLRSHPYVENRTPARSSLDERLLAAVGRVLPLAHRVWARPGVEPRTEWLEAHEGSWRAAVELVASGKLSALARANASIDAVITQMLPILESTGASAE